MKENYYVILKKHPIRNTILFELLIVLLFISILLIAVLINNHFVNKVDSAKIEYYEDVDNDFTFSQIKNDISDQQYTTMNGGLFYKGYSTSTWWLRIKLADTSFADSADYITIDNIYNKYCNLYVPVAINGTVTYTKLRSGYSYQGNDDKNFIYPAFQLPAHIVKDQYIYIQIAAASQQNSEISFYSAIEYHNLVTNTFLFYGIAFGCCLALAIYCFLIFYMDRRGRFYLYIFFSVIIATLSYMINLGIFQFFFKNSLTFLNPRQGFVGWLSNIVLLVLITDCFRDQVKKLKGKKLLLSFWFLSIIEAFISLHTINLVIGVIGLIGMIIFGILIYVAFTYGLAYYYQKAMVYFFFGYQLAQVFNLYTVLRKLGYLHIHGAIQYFPIICLVAAFFCIIAAAGSWYEKQKEESERVQLQLREAEELARVKRFEFLQAQIKPHFIHNTINVIAALCTLDPLKAKNMISDLSNYLKCSFNFSNCTDCIPVNEELAYIKTYVNIEKERFLGDLSVEYRLIDTGELKIPPLIFEPLVENAIRHGVRKSKRHGIILITISDQGNSYQFSVSDNGGGMTDATIDKLLNGNWEKGSGIGIKNINHRLKKLYGTCLEYQSTVDNGTTVSFIIPKNNEKGC